MHLSQPAVSIQIKRLEEQVGLPLFEKVGKQIYPTPAGKLVYQASEDILGRVNELKNSVESLMGEVRGPIELSLVTTTQFFLPHLLGQFLQLHPDVEPRLRFSNRAEVVERLTHNEDDFVIMGQIPPSMDLITYPFMENVLVPVAPSDHPLVGKKNIPLEQLTKERFLEREKGSGTRLALETLMASQGLKLEPYMELGSVEALKQAVMAGLGLAMLSLHALRVECAADRLSVLDVQGFPLSRRWYAVHLKGKQLSLASQTFLNYLLEEGTHNLGVEFNQCI